MAKNRRIWLGWGAFGCVLIGLAFALDAWLPPSPRFELRDPHIQNLWGETTLCADGKILMTGTLGQTADDGWVCDSLRSWDTVTGGERGRFFGDLAKADPQAILAFQPEYSPGRRFCALVHSRGLAVADLVAGKEWPTALSWDNARQGPRQFSPLYRLLQVPINTRGLQEKVKLGAALELFSDMFDGKLPILVNKAAFEEEFGGNAEDPYEEEIWLPPVPKKMPVATALRLTLAQIGKGKATYIVRRNFVEITTWKHLGEDQVVTPVFSAKGSFVAVAEGLSNVYKLHIVECATGQRIASLPLHAEVMGVFGFTPDEELLYYFASDEGQPLFTVWNMRTKQIVRTIREIDLTRETDDFLLAPDGKTLLVDKEHSATGCVDLFDLQTGHERRCFEFGVPRAFWNEKPQVCRFMFSPDNRTLVRIAAGELYLWDLAADKIRGRIKLDDAVEQWPYVFISADSRVIGVVEDEVGFAAWSLESTERLWQHTEPNALGAYPRSTPDRRYVVERKGGRIDFLDPATGVPHTSVSLGENMDSTSQIKFTPDGRWMLSEWRFKQNREPWFLQKWAGKWWPFPEPIGYAVVTEVATGRTVLRISDPGASYVLSDDGGTLMSCCADNENQGVICCWDVPGRPARSRVVGIPLALAGAATAMQWWLIRKKGPRQPSREPIQPQFVH